MPKPQARDRAEPLSSVRLEHEVRYRAAAAIIAEAALWCDLGCGTGTAAAAALEQPPARAVLVDRDPALAEEAAGRVGAGAVALAADLARPEDVERVRAAILDGEGETRVVTCFETLERLETFVPLVEMLADAGERHGVTVVLGLPDDALGAPADAARRSTWTEAAFEELRRLLPDDTVEVPQVALAGSVVLAGRTAGEIELELPVSVPVEEVRPTHRIVAFGPAAPRLLPAGAAGPYDAAADRAASRLRDAQLEHDEAELAELRAEVERLRAELREREPASAAERPALDRAR